MDRMARAHRLDVLTEIAMEIDGERIDAVIAELTPARLNALRRCASLSPAPGRAMSPTMASWLERRKLADRSDAGVNITPLGRAVLATLAHDGGEA